MTEPKKFYILCDSGRDIALWWRADRAGYTIRLDDAGKYGEPEARSIERTRGTDHAIECSLVDAIAFRAVSVDQVPRWDRVFAMHTNGHTDECEGWASGGICGCG